MRAFWVSIVLVVLPVAPVGAREPAIAAVRVTASSTFKSIDRDVSFDAYNVVAGLQTSWCEGNPKTAVGESIRLVFDRPLAIDQIAINNTFDTAVALGVPDRRFAKVVEATATADDGRAFQLVWRPAGAFWAPIGGAPVRELTFTITKVQGPADGVACITEIVARRGDRNYDLFPGEAKAIAPLVAMVTALQAALATCDDKQLAKTLDFPIGRMLPDSNRMLKPTAPVKTAADLAALCRADPTGYSLGASADGALEQLGFISPTIAEVGSFPSIWKFEWAKARWHLRDITSLK